MSVRPLTSSCRLFATALVFMIGSGALAVERIELRLSEPDDTTRVIESWPTIVGVAIPQGELKSLHHARVVDRTGREVVSQLDAACFWNSQPPSIKWLLVDVLMDVRGKHAPPFYLEYGLGVARAPIESPLRLRETQEGYEIDTGRLEIAVNKQAFRLFAHVRLDLNGDGRYEADEELLETASNSGLFWIDQHGVRYDASRDGGMSWEVEVQGPVRITLRGEGWYVSPNGKKVMKQITRMRFHPGADWVRVYHTFIWTAGEETPIKQITLQSVLSTEPARTALGIDGKRHEIEGDVTLLQDTYRHATWTSRGCQQSATRCDGWIEASVGRGRVAAMVRDCAEQQPKGFAVDGRTLSVHLYPPHEKLLSVSEEARLTRQHRSHPQWAEHRQYTFDSDGVHRYMPTGFAKTHEVVYRFLPATAPINEVEKSNDLLQRPVVAFADPKRTCKARPFGYSIPPEDPQRWPREEELLDAVYRWGSKYDEEMDAFEILNFGDVIWWQGPGRNAAHYRYWGNQSKGWVNVPWYLFARSGSRYYAVRGEQHARHVMDVDTVNYGARSGTGLWPRVIGAQWQYCSVHFGWTASLLSHWQQYEYLYSCYYLTGYERARRRARELEASVLASDYGMPAEGTSFFKESPGKPPVPFDGTADDLGRNERVANFTRAQYNTINQLTVLGVNSSNFEFLRLAERYQRVALLNRTEQGVFRGNHMNLPVSQIRYHLATADPVTAEAIVDHAKCVGASEKFHDEMLFLAYAYELTGDLTFLECAASRLRILTQIIDLGQDAYNRGAYYRGTQEAGDRFFLGTLLTLAHIEARPTKPAPLPRGLFVDSGPADVGPNMRLAYVLEQKDGPFELCVHIQKRGGIPATITVTAPSGSEATSKTVVPRIDPEETVGVPSGSGHYNVVSHWLLRIPTDGETGVYTVQISETPWNDSRTREFPVRLTSSTGKVVWYIPTKRIAFQGWGGGGLWFHADSDFPKLEVKDVKSESPFVFRLYDPDGTELGNTESIGPSPKNDMKPVNSAVDVTAPSRDGLWFFTAASRFTKSLTIGGALPFFATSPEQWFDPRNHDIMMDGP